MAGNRVLLDSGEFTSNMNRNPETSYDPKELLQAKSDLATADRKFKAANAQIERLEKEYQDLKQCYDTVYKELSELKKKSLGISQEKKQK